jgi:hypothetical protein
VKVTAILLESFLRLIQDGVCLMALDAEHNLAMRATAFLTLGAALDEFKDDYNNLNVSGPSGGIPRVGRTYRTRPAGAPDPGVFDYTVDWVAEYTAARQRQGRTVSGPSAVAQFVLTAIAQVGSIDAEAAWFDCRRSYGRGGALHSLYASTLAAVRACGAPEALRRQAMAPAAAIQ